MTDYVNWFWHSEKEAKREAKRVVIFDMDGVLADATHRQHYLRGDRWDWPGFFSAIGQDPPLRAGMGMLATVKASPDHVATILTARPHYIAEESLHWLAEHGKTHGTAYGAEPDLMITRAPDTERISSVKFKRAEVARLREAGYSIDAAIDDDQNIIDMYLEEGINALYLHSGYYEQRSSQFVSTQ